MNKESSDPNPTFAIQNQIREPWRQFLDELSPLRPDLYSYCCRLTGNIWDAEDLVQDAMLRVFSLMGKLDADIENPKAYLIRAATNLWIDRIRRSARERTILALDSNGKSNETPVDPIDSRDAATQLLQNLHPQERAAIVLKDLLDLSLAETASILNTTVGSVKSALLRGRSRLDERAAPAGFNPPDRVLVEQFMGALQDIDLDSLKTICATDLRVELVGGAEMASFEQSRSFFQHAHFVMPTIGFGENPHWELIDYRGESMVLGYRTLEGLEGINEVHRIEVTDGKISRIRCYCFCPDTLKALGDELSIHVLPRPYRSPS